jgi:ATP-dependent Lon protease
VGRKRSVAAVQAAERSGLWVVLLAQRDGAGDSDIQLEPNPDQLHTTGVLAKIEKIRGDAESGYQAVVRGERRIFAHQLATRDDGVNAYIEAFVDEAPDRADLDPATSKALLTSLKTLAHEILDLLPADTRHLTEILDGIEDLAFLTHLCAANLEIPPAAKQRLLEILSVKDRSLALLELLQTQRDQLQVQSEVRDRLTRKLGKNQREHILREQLRAIQDELGEGDSEKSDDYRKRIDDAKLPEAARKVALDELKRLEAIGNASPESHVIRNYLDLLCSLPWSKSSDVETIDLEGAREILEREHAGLAKVKKRILQHLAVLKLVKQDAGRKGSILLLVGPPGVGKTSLGASVARALGRKFVRASLGGVRDDAEIRGHRRTYIGAMPGRIIQSLKRAGENNPVIMLDEIDKLANSFHGDPAAALLEVLDPEQNANFLDHYLDVPFDLSNAFFIATANSLENIPGPLLDRMEVIDLTGYTPAEKLHIARNHLVPKQLSEHGLKAAQLEIPDETLSRIISHYTREAGVRDLQRRIAGVARGSAEAVLKATELPVKVGVDQLEELLGAERFLHEVAPRISPPGVVTGLAWTPMGGEILFVEAGSMPGTGRLTLTGQLGDVMKESAQIALSLVRASLPAADFEKRDLHLHVPAGAIPKDGPSAGVTLLTAIASLLSGKSVDPKLAMTGEITLRGNVLPVGGIKEKVLAAHRAGIERIILSRRNERDLKDVPEEVRSKMRFEVVDTAEELLKLALGIDFRPMAAPIAAFGFGGGAPAPAVA